jgi:predicted secreted Zn-dependent protease
MAVVTKGKGKVSTEFDEILATGINRAKRGDLTWAKYITDTLVAAIERHEKQLTQAEQAQAVQLNQQINVSVQQQKYDLTRLTPDEINTWRELARKCAVDQGT